MGLFSWLFGESFPIPVTSRVYLTEESQDRAMIGDIRKHLADGRSVLLLTHFPSTLESVLADLRVADIPHERLPTPPTAPQVLHEVEDRSWPVLFAGLARDLVPDLFAPEHEDAPVDVVVAEVHFLRSHDDTIISFAGGLGTQCRVTFYTSLDAPLLAMFAGDWVKGALEKLGMQKDEAIDSRLVSRRIRRAQDKVASYVDDERLADSPEEWKRLNILK